MSATVEMQEATRVKNELTGEEKLQFDVQFATWRKDPTQALAISIVAGTLGIDRFYIGDIGLGIVKLLTLGGLFLWTLIDWFLIMGATRDKNTALMHQVRDSIVQSRT